MSKVETRSSATPATPTKSEVERYFETALAAFEKKIMKLFNDRFTQLEEKFGKFDETVKKIESSLNNCLERVAENENKLVTIEESLKNGTPVSV